MPTFRIVDGEYRPYVSAIIEDPEEHLEDELENNPHVLLAPEKLLYVGRQMRTNDGRALDLLAIDRDRRPVIIELKKNRTPREMMAQALEYAAFITQLPSDELDLRAAKYFLDRGRPWTSIREAHATFFEGQVAPDDSSGWEVSNSVIIVLEGQTIASQILDVALLLKKHNLDIRIVQFGYQLDSAGDRLVSVDTIFGPDNVDTNGTNSVLAFGQRLDTAPAADAFKHLRDALHRLGLVRRDTGSGVSFVLPRSGGTIAAVWLASSTGKRAYLLVYKQQVEGDLDAFQATAERSGFHVERGTNLSVHVYPQDDPRIETLISDFARLCMGAAQSPMANT